MLAGLLLGALAVGLCTVIVLLGLSARDIETGLSSGEIVEDGGRPIVLATGAVGGDRRRDRRAGAQPGRRDRRRVSGGSSAENFTTIPTFGDWVQKYGLNGVTNALSNLESD